MAHIMPKRERGFGMKPCSAVDLRVFFTVVCILGSGCARVQAADPRGSVPSLVPVAVTVGLEPRQTFEGLGASAWGSGDYMRLSAEQRAHLNDLLWRQARFNTLRIWLRLKDYAPTPGERRFKKAFPDSQARLVRDAIAAGVKHLVVGPSALPDYLMERLPTKGHDGNGQAVEPYLKPARMEEHAAIIADFIRDLRDEAHLVPEATGIQNEPNDPNDCVFTPQDVVHSARLLRAALDARGLSRVQLIAPESVGCNAPAGAQLGALRADATAWSALGGIASHDYDGGATRAWAQAIAGTPKTYWMTEFCAGGPEEPGDFFRGAAEASAFLADMNHRVNFWLHFIGYLSDDPHDNGTRLISYFERDSADQGWCKIFEPYYYLKDLGLTFDPGAVFRPSTSSLDQDMAWTSKSRRELIVATARNPNGSWAIGLSDFTAERFPPRFWFKGKPARSFEVTLRIQELAQAGPLQFESCRRGPQLKDCLHEGVTMHQGTLTLSIHPLELITLRSR
jgi:hypothetical protein